MFEMYHKLFNWARLIVIYIRRILFVKNSFDISFWTKIKANLCGGFLGDQWALYNLDMKKKNEYLSEFDWYKSRYINEPFDYMLNNKVVTTEVLKNYIRVPKIFAVSNKRTVTDMQGESLGEDDILNIIKRETKVMVKPFSKGKGTGVHLLEFKDNKFFIDSILKTEDEIKKLLIKKTNWYLSECLNQHSYAKALYDKTVNTIRVITLRDPKTSKIKVFFAVQRIGTKDTIPVDNASMGGLVCKIDLQSGRLSEARSLKNSNVYEFHPDSNIKFGDVFIPDFEKLKRELLKIHCALPYLNFVAWDIVKLENGENCVIEANTSSGVNIIQLWGGQRKNELGDFYRFYNVIK